MHAWESFFAAGVFHPESRGLTGKYGLAVELPLMPTRARPAGYFIYRPFSDTFCRK